MINPADSCTKDLICNKSSNMTRKGDRTAVLKDIIKIKFIKIYFNNVHGSQRAYANNACLIGLI